MSRAPSAKSERKRSQSRFCPAGPEITSYTAFTIASGEDTSSGRPGRAARIGIAPAFAANATRAAFTSAGLSSMTKCPAPAISTIVASGFSVFT